MKKVEVEMQDGKNLTYAEVESVEQGKYDVSIYDKDHKVLALLNRRDIKNLITQEVES